MKLLVLFFLFTQLVFAEDHYSGVEFAHRWEKVRNFSCADDPKFKANRKFNRLFTLIQSLEFEAPTVGCEEKEGVDYLESENAIPLTLQGKLQFAKDLEMQAIENSLMQMTYLFYRIYDDEERSSTENIPLDRLASSITSLVYGGYDRETFRSLKQKSQDLIDTLQESGVKREPPQTHAKKFNLNIESQNEILAKDEPSSFYNFLNYKRQYHADLASDVGLLMATERMTERMGGDIYQKESLKCVRPYYSHKIGMTVGPKEETCSYPQRKARIRAEDVTRSLMDLRFNFHHATKKHDKLKLYESQLRYHPVERHPNIEAQIDEYLGDMLVYSPRSFTQVLSQNVNNLQYVCSAFDYAFEREGDEHINTKLMNGVEFFAPAAMWITALGIMPFLKDRRTASSHKIAIKGIMGITFLDLLWRGKNLLEINDERKRYEHELLAGNADIFTLEEFERLKEQYVEDKKGIIIVATYEALSLVAIGRIAKILAKRGVTKYMNSSREVDELFDFARFNPAVMRELGKKGITNQKSFIAYLKRVPEKDRIKFAESIMDVKFGAGQLLTAGVSLKEIGDTLYFMYGMPYIPQGISATE